MPSGMGGLIVAGLLLMALNVSAYQAPSAAKQVPADAAWVLLLDQLGDSAIRGTALASKFKDLHPDLDPAKWRAKIKAELGVDLLTPAGMSAMGFDPEGTIAIWSPDFDSDPHLALPLSDVDLFVKKMSEIYQRKSGKPAKAPTVKAGVKTLELGPDRFAIKGKWALLLQPRQPGSKQGDPIKAFFGRGKKLASQKAFQSACKQLPARLHAMVYLSMVALQRSWVREISRDLADHEKRLKGISSASSKKWMQAQIAGIRRVKKQFTTWLGQFVAVAFGIELSDNAVDWTMVASTTGKGKRALAGVLPAGATAPAFHAGLLQASLMGGWASLRVSAFLDWISDLPEAPWLLVGDGLTEADKGFREEFGLGLLTDVLGNLREPLSAYLLTPDLGGLKPDDPMDAQIMQLIRFLTIARVADRAKAEQFLSKLTEKLKAEGRPLEHKQLHGAQLTIFKPEPGVELSWGLKGDVFLFGVGHDAVTPAARLVDAGSFRLARASTDRGLGQLDFAAVGETLSSAVAKGIGGQQGTQFRMTWPLLQQVLARFDKLTFTSDLSASGLRIKAVLGIR